MSEAVHASRSSGVEEVCYLGYQVHDQAVGWVSGVTPDGGDATFGDVAFLSSIVWGIPWILLFMLLYAWPIIKRKNAKA